MPERNIMRALKETPQIAQHHPRCGRQKQTNGQGTRQQDEPVGDLTRVDNIAFLLGVIELLLSRLFCFLTLILVVTGYIRPLRCAQETANDGFEMIDKDKHADADGDGENRKPHQNL